MPALYALKAPCQSSTYHLFLKKIKENSYLQIQHNKKLKEEGKRMRMDKEVVMDKLFSVFEKHQYYNISDLVRLTNQPIVSCFSFILTLEVGGGGGRGQLKWL